MFEKGYDVNYLKWGRAVIRWMKREKYSYRSLGATLGVDKQWFVRIKKGEPCDIGLYLALCMLAKINPYEYFQLAVEVTAEMFPETEYDNEENPFIMFDKVGQ